MTLADQQNCPDSSRLRALLDGNAADDEQKVLAHPTLVWPESIGFCHATAWLTILKLSED
jgi:hypothetical protein